jgi:CTP:molybdopterin cytidylyltransferase MocA
MTPILILAAGQSRRMAGRDKLLEPLNGIPLLRRQALTALALGEPVFVTLPSGDHPRAMVLDGLDVTSLAVPDAAEGLAGTLRGAIAQLPPCDRIMLLLGDLVEITESDLRNVLQATENDATNLIWRGATANGEPGHPIVFAASLRPAFADLSGDGGGESIVRPLRDRTVLVPLPGQHARRDLDTPEDWAAFRRESGS